ncbi:hypothetical protein ABPG73_006428 [Tetrahymena malaccensis]
MDKQKISFQKQDQIQPTQNQFNQNQLCQQVSCSQLLQKQEGSSNIQNQLEHTNISTTSEQTVLKKLKSQIVRRIRAQNMVFQNAIYQTINQKKEQHAIIFYQNQANQQFIERISFKNPKVDQQDKNTFNQKQNQTTNKQIPKNQIDHKQLKYIEQKTDIDLQKAKKEDNKEQTLKLQQATNNQVNDNLQENSERKVFQQDNQYSQNDFNPSKCQIKQKQTILDYALNEQIICRQLKYLNKKNDIYLKMGEQEHNKEQTLQQKQINNQGNEHFQENPVKKIVKQDNSSPQNDFSQQIDQIKQKQVLTQQVSDNHINYRQYLDEKNEIDIQKDEQENNKEQKFNKEQTNDQVNDNQQENTEREVIQYDINLSQNDLSIKDGQIKQIQITKEKISNSQIDFIQINEIQEKTDMNLQNIQSQHSNLENLQDKNISNLEKVNLQENTDKGKNYQYQKQKEQIDDKQQIFQQSDYMQQKDQQLIQSMISQYSEQYISKQLEKENNQSQIYSSQLNEIFGRIKEYVFSEYEKSFELDQGVFQVQRVWEDEIFDRVNQIKTQSEKFKSQKQNIFERLKEEQLYLCKIIYSSQLEDLILGFYLEDNNNFDEYENSNEYIFKIIYDPNQSDIDVQAHRIAKNAEIVRVRILVTM